MNKSLTQAEYRGRGANLEEALKAARNAFWTARMRHQAPTGEITVVITVSGPSS